MVDQESKNASSHQQQRKKKSFKLILRFYRLFITRWRLKKKEKSTNFNQETLKGIGTGSGKESGNRSISRPPLPLNRHGSLDRNSFSFTPWSNMNRNWSKRSIESNGGGYMSQYGSRRVSTPIMFSNSSGLLKPPTVEKRLECTLEELCFGCTKHINVTRDTVTISGEIIQEEELLTMQVEAGWTKGTKIKFEGKGNEIPGVPYPADITFVIAEKHHHLFTRDGDDLELVLEIPLLQALTGCTISVPLLGKENMSLTIDDIIYPGYEKILPGLGMPTKLPGQRGDLKLIFLVQFPKQLTHRQRLEILSVLEGAVD